MPFPWNALVGTELDGKYRLRSLLGAGGFGGVFLADETVSGRVMRQVALKVINDARCRFEELAVLLNVDHPHVIKAFAPGHASVKVGSADVPLLYLAMEVARGSLDRRLHLGTLTDTSALKLAKHVALALAHLHERKFIHGDVKPANILRVGDAWKVSDFGLVRFLGDESQLATRGAGTGPYLSPEVLAGASSSARDVWALGVTLTRALTGQFPFSGDSDADFVDQVRSRPPVFARPLSPKLRLIVEGCLEKSTASRLTAAALVELVSPRLPVTIAGDVVVDQQQPSGFTTIADALASTPRPARIVVRPGTYRESLQIERPLRLAAEGGRVVIDGDSRPAIVVMADQVDLCGLELRSSSNGPVLDVRRGNPRVEDCRIDGVGDAVAFDGRQTAGAVNRCVIVARNGTAVAVSGYAHPTIRKSEIFGGRAGIVVTDGGNPTVQATEVKGGVTRGILVGSLSRGHFDHVAVEGSAGNGIELGGGSAATFSRCNVTGNGVGVFAAPQAKGSIIDCNLRGNLRTWQLAHSHRLTRHGNSE